MLTLSKEMQNSIPTFLKGTLAGIVALAIGGQFWPGYMLDSSAKISRDQAIEAANIKSASLLCGEYYKAAPDSAARLTQLRSTTSYVGEDKDIVTAVTGTLKAFQTAGILPLPNEYRLKSDCVEVLRKKPEKSVQLRSVHSFIRNSRG